MVCVPGGRHDTWVSERKTSFAKSEKDTSALEDLMWEINTQKDGFMPGIQVQEAFMGEGF